MLQELDVRLEQAILTDLVQVCVCAAFVCFWCCSFRLFSFFVSLRGYTFLCMVVVAAAGFVVVAVVVIIRHRRKTQARLQLTLLPKYDFFLNVEISSWWTDWTTSGHRTTCTTAKLSACWRCRRPRPHPHPRQDRPHRKCEKEAADDWMERVGSLPAEVRECRTEG